MNDDILSELQATAVRYCDGVKNELDARWAAWPIDPLNNPVHEVVGGLLARQVTLATELVLGPPIWTGQIAPLVLRAMVDLRITLGWILLSPTDRAAKFIEYGLGQMKLHMEHVKAAAEQRGEPADTPVVKGLEAWINEQRFHFLTDVNVGSWSDLDLRKMAAECGLEELYRFDYWRWSSCTHNMWHHIQPLNLSRCTNALHRGGHRVPHVPQFEPDINFPLTAAEYLDDTFSAFDAFREIEPTVPSTYAWFAPELETVLHESVNDGAQNSADTDSQDR